MPNAQPYLFQVFRELDAGDPDAQRRKHRADAIVKLARNSLPLLFPALVVACLDGYATTASLLTEADIAGRTIVELGTGTPEQAQDAAATFGERGAAYLDGEYGIHGLFVGVPCKLGANGIEKIYELKLTAEETAALHKSSGAVKELVDVIKSKM